MCTCLIVYATNIQICKCEWSNIINIYKHTIEFYYTYKCILKRINIKGITQ